MFVRATLQGETINNNEEKKKERYDGLFNRDKPKKEGRTISFHIYSKEFVILHNDENFVAYARDNVPFPSVYFRTRSFICLNFTFDAVVHEMLKNTNRGSPLDHVDCIFVRSFLTVEVD